MNPSMIVNVVMRPLSDDRYTITCKLSIMVKG